jgi:hypothetical protein
MCRRHYLANRIKTESLPEWVTAVATAVQTIVVSVALVVAYMEWKGHQVDREEDRVKAVLGIYRDGYQDAAKETSFLSQVGHLSDCQAAQKRVRETSPSDPIHTNLRPVLNSCVNVPAISGKEIGVKARHTVDRLNKISLCAGMKLCDRELSEDLFCDDAVAFRYLAEPEQFLSEMPSTSPYFISFIKECVERNMWSVTYDGVSYDILTYRAIPSSNK